MKRLIYSNCYLLFFIGLVFVFTGCDGLYRDLDGVVYRGSDGGRRDVGEEVGSEGDVDVGDKDAERGDVDADREDAEGFDADREDAEGFDADREDAEDFDADREDAEDFDADREDAEDFDADGEDAEDFDADGEDDDIDCDPLGDPDPFGGGDGSASDPFRLCSPAHIKNIHTELEAYFRLETDVDMEGVMDFKPIGRGQGSGFTGHFDGNKKKISNLTIDDNSLSDRIGFFGQIGPNGIVYNLSLEDLSIDGHEKSRVGGLAGFVDGGKVESVSCDSCDVKGKQHVGGLVGTNHGKVKNSYAKGSVIGEMYVGGLVGTNGKTSNEITVTIDSSHAEGDVKGYRTVGGLVGMNLSGSTIRRGYALGEISRRDSGGTSNDFTNFGGLVGHNVGNIEQSYARGDVNAKDSQLVGGLVGGYSGGEIKECYVQSELVSGEGYVGGLVGASQSGGEISYSYAKIGVVQSASGVVGGAIGQMSGSQINEIYAMNGKVQASGSGNGGQLIGAIYGSSGSSSGSYACMPDLGGELESSYWSKETTCVNCCSNQDHEYGEGLLATEFSEKDSFSGWDFEVIWEMSTDKGRPVHRWESSGD